MARITLADLSPAVREQVMAQYGMVPKKVKPKQIGAALSPYADLLGDALDTRFPVRMLREYQPIKDRKFRIDFAFPVEKVAIEFDGYRYHGFSKKGFKQGLERQNILVAHGWRVLRYTLTDVRDRLDVVIKEIGSALAISCEKGVFVIEIDMEERLSDVSDIATRNEQADIAMRLEERRLAVLNQEAPDEDAKGNRFCLNCADDIPPERVQAVNAVRCVVCAGKRERLLKLGAQRGGARRKAGYQADTGA